jgi:hypothetical protein
MSLIKLAMQPLVIVNKTDPNAGSSKTLNPKNVAAAVVGGTTGFGLKEAIEKLPNFNKDLMSHRYASRMGSVLGGFAGAAATYGVLNRKNKQQDQSPKFYMY